MKKNKNLSLDKIKLIASLCIIAIHTYPLMSLNANIDFLISRVLFRVAVPLFLMITGYFILKESLKNKNILKEFTKKILKIYLLSILIYLPINLYISAFKNLTVLEIIKEFLITGTFYHLWYFPALILGLWLTYFIIKNTKEKYASIIFVVLYTLGLLGDSYYGAINDIKIIESFYNVIFTIFEYSRNGLFYVPIFLYLGYLTNKNNLKIEKKKNVILIAICTLLLLIEGYILHYFAVQQHDSMYIMLIPLMVLLFNAVINNKGKENKILRSLSTTVYIIHPVFIILIIKLGEILNIEKYIVDNSIIHFILVLITTLIFSIGYEKIKLILKKQNRKTITKNKF